MILDLQNLFSNAQAVTADAVSENIIDTGAPGLAYNGQAIGRDVGIGPWGLYVFAHVVETFLTTVSLSIQIRTKAADADISSGATTLFTGPAIVVATLVAGYRFALPPLFRGVLRYVGLFYDVSTSATAGKITAGVALTKQENPA
jgi:hypothetical protein